MDRSKYTEMCSKLNSLIDEGCLENKKIFFFGHCNATEEAIDILLSKGFEVESVFDNNPSKHGLKYKGIPIANPNEIIKGGMDDGIVFIVTRFYEAMNKQLRDLGFSGLVEKLVNFNSYSEYSLSQKTVSEKEMRLKHGMKILEKIQESFPDRFRVFCPYSSLGDVYYCMSYLPYFLEKKEAKKAVICVYTQSCREVVSTFGEYDIEVLPQSDLESAIQATLYLKDENGFIAHNDKPYVMNLTKALYFKKISFETLYKCGVFGLPVEEKPCIPYSWDEYHENGNIAEGRSVILSPYAGSVTSIGDRIWFDIRDEYLKNGYDVYTNTAPGENPLEGTKAVSPRIREMKSLVERAGTFIGLRSGLCDVIKSANCKKIALYPDYNFSDTKWKSIDVFSLDGFENIVIKDGTEWKRAL